MKEGIKKLRLKQSRQLPTVSLNFLNDIGILYKSSFWSQFLRFVLFLGVYFSCRINLENCVFLVSCENEVYYFFEWNSCRPSLPPPRDEYFSVSTQIIFCWVYQGIYLIYRPSQRFSCWQKSLIIPLSDFRLNFLLKWGQHTKTIIRLQ